jgi:hypothetical protein
MLGTGRLRIKPVISEVRRPEDAPGVYKRLAEDPRFPLGLAFEWKKG